MKLRKLISELLLIEDSDGNLEVFFGTIDGIFGLGKVETQLDEDDPAGKRRVAVIWSDEDD
jgi:hypothetical protein